MGVDEASIAGHLERHGFTDESGVFELWECHVPALDVAQRCQLHIIAGAAGVMVLGIASLEVESACRATGHGFTADLVDDVQMIAKGMAERINSKPNGAAGKAPLSGPKKGRRRR